jgi:hypothetical protein
MTTLTLRDCDRCGMKSVPVNTDGTLYCHGNLTDGECVAPADNTIPTHDHSND